ncbi:vacuolar amino acid permease [Schizopora paradoxa]|uniref:Vacuolar amino acid permease n=1 Tax=Schizopora paradoxa TaxID=27342 RepID=A0A0H2RMJ3_9AGAM|nr:vacuolar amino acid permease [Schizopora paradoxa]
MPASNVTGEREPLLSTRPPSYDAATNDSDSETDAASAIEQDEQPTKPLNQVSRADLIWVLAGLWSAVFLGALDGTIVATLLTPIGSHFQKSNQASYIGTAYLLSVCCFTPLYGRLSDILGRKGAMLLALSLFGSGTIFCGFAPSMESLIAARAIAGMGGGGLLSVSSVAVTDLIPLKQRGLYQGMANISIPVLAFSAILVFTKVSIKLPSDVEKRSTYDKLRRIDFFGSTTLVITVGCALLGFSLKTSEELPWTHPLILGLFAISVAFGVAFVLVETYVAPFPVMPLHLITRRTPLFVSLANFVYFSAVKLQSASSSGLHLLPHSVALSTGSVFAGWLMRRTGKLYLLTLLSALSATMSTLLLCFWGERTSSFHLWLDIVPQGFGMASLITSTLIAMIASVTREDLAVATGITYLFRTTGQVLGVSLSGAALQALLLRSLRQKITGPHAGDIIEAIRHSTSIIPTLEPEMRKAAVDAYGSALQIVFVFQATANFLAFLCCLPIQENPLP